MEVHMTNTTNIASVEILKALKGHGSELGLSMLR